MFWLTGMGEVTELGGTAHRWLILEFDRINPLQWITAAFMHADWLHLIGNTIFLWCFGLIVEGKIGWQKFAMLYAGLCLADGAISQIPMFILSSHPMGGALGASGVIFALMAIALCWAPENEIRCIVGIWYYIRPIEVPVFGFAIFYVGLQILPLAFGGIQMSTPMLHLLGMSVGFPFALYMLKHNLVDCEGWDIVTRWRHLPRDPWAILTSVFRSPNHRRRATELAATCAIAEREAGQEALRQIHANPSAFNPPVAKVSVIPSPASIRSPLFDPNSALNQQSPHPTPNEEATESFRVAIENDQPREATKAYRSIRLSADTRLIQDETLVCYVKLLGRHGEHKSTLNPLKVLVARRSSYSNEACLRIARIQLQLKSSPAAAKAALDQMTQPISQGQVAKRDRILSACRASLRKTGSEVC